VLQVFFAIDDYFEERAALLSEAVASAERAVMELRDSIEEAKTLVAGTAAEPSLAAVIATPAECGLAGTGSGVFRTGHLDLLAPDGTDVCSSVVETGAPEGATYAGEPWLREAARAGGAIVSQTFVDPLVAETGIAVVAPVAGANRRAGFFMQFLSWRGVAERLGDETGQVEVLGADGLVLDSGGTVTARRGPAAAASGEYAGPDGVARLYGIATLDDPAVALWWGIPAREAIRQAGVSAAQRGAFLSLALIVLLLLGRTANRSIARPLRALAQAIAVSGEDTTPQRVQVDGPAEIATVSDAYNEMLEARLAYERQLLHQALHDQFTDLPNRALVVDRLKRALAQSQRPESVAVLFVDLDGFRALNDSLGHEAGDQVLRDAGDRIRAAIRPSDTLGRFGGDEFVVLAEGLDGTYQAAALAERIQHALVEPFEAGNVPATMSASIGIAVRNGHRTAEALLRDADAAMHRAKQRGRARYEVFDDALRARVTDRLQIENALREALSAGRIVTVYQPKVAVDTRTISGAEALVRWRHEEGHLISPARFIPVAEESGLIAGVGREVLGQAAREVTAWKRDGFPIQVSVNVSVKQMLGSDFAQLAGEVVRESGADPDDIMFEITEGVLLEEDSPAAETLGRLKAMGFGLSLDDFGTGYSSLAYLHRFPIDELKIDRAFVKNLGRGTGEEPLVTAIIAMGHALNKKVVAEGVEQSAQFEALRALGCDAVQGYLFSRPVDEASFRVLLADGIGETRDAPEGSGELSGSDVG